MENKVIKMAVNAIRKTAEISAESTSVWALYQPKTPQKLTKKS